MESLSVGGTSRIYAYNRHLREVKWQKPKQATTIVLGESLSIFNPVIWEGKSGLDIDKLIVSPERTILDDYGLPKFPLITSLFKIAASLSLAIALQKMGSRSTSICCNYTEIPFLQIPLKSCDSWKTPYWVLEVSQVSQLWRRCLSHLNLLILATMQTLKQNVISRKKKKKQIKEERLNSSKRRMTKMKETPSSHQSSKWAYSLKLSR